MEILAPLSLTARVPNPQSRVTKQSCHWGVNPCGGVKNKTCVRSCEPLAFLVPKLTFSDSNITASV